MIHFTPASPAASASLSFNREGLSDETLLTLYEQILFPRLIEEKMLILLRQGRVSKWFSGIGQEAIAVGVTAALRPDDYVLPLHRNLGVFTTRQVPLDRLVAQWQGKETGFSHGRERSFHFGIPDYRIIGMISHLGAMLPVADGLSLAGKLKNEDFIAVPFSGDGGASEGDFHEALNVASVWDLPVLFILENNGYGLSTPTSLQSRARCFADRALGYGMEGITIDGNNILEVYRTVTRVVEKMRTDKRPVLLECNTFRMRGHEEASGVKYVPQELMDTWARRDPVKTYEAWLEQQGLLPADLKDAIYAELKSRIEEAVKHAFEQPDPQPDMQRELASVYAPKTMAPATPADPAAGTTIRFIDAIRDGLRESLIRFPNLLLMGQDIGAYGGAFKVTEGLMDEFGEDRVRNTPLCESAILGAALGLSLEGQKSMVEMQFADFVSCGFNQIVNNLAKNHYRWGHAADVVVRMPTGAGSGAGPFHSQSNEAWFTHVAGLKVVYPSNPEEAKGLLCAALADPNPVMFFEHKGLYRSVSGHVPAGYYETPIGEARIVRSGADATIVTYGMGVHWALQAAENLKDEAEIEVIDLRSLLPWDQETVFASVRKTGKCLVFHEDTLTGGFGGEIAAAIGEACFQWLDAPVTRLGAADTPVPFHPDLEADFLPKAKLDAVLRKLLAF